MSNSIVSLFEMHDKKDAHCLMELSNREWERYKDSSIHVSGRVEDKSNKCIHIYYEDIIIGKNVSIMKRRSMCNGKNIWWEEVNLPVMKHGYFFITTPKAELLQDTSIHIVDTAIRTVNNDKGDDKYKPSGIVLLLMCRLDAKQEISGLK